MEVTGEVALEAAPGFSFGLVFGDATLDVFLGTVVVLAADHDDSVEGSSYMEPTLPEAVTAEIDLIMGFYSDGISVGVLKDLPEPVLLSLSTGVAASLLRQHLAGALVLDDDLSAAAADACWDAISV